MIAAQCRAARGLLDMTVKGLATRARVAPDTIVRLENGREMKPRTIDAVRRALETAGVEFLPAGVRFRCGPMCGWDGAAAIASQSPRPDGRYPGGEPAATNNGDNRNRDDCRLCTE